jgi:hypothetical protein
VLRVTLVAGVVDELTLDVAPVLLGAGERALRRRRVVRARSVEVLHSPLATHIRFRRSR